MTTTQRPLVFLDVDGTILPLGGTSMSEVIDGWDEWRDRSNPLIGRIPPTLGFQLRALGCDLVWATAWGQEANDVLSPFLGFPRLPVLGFDDAQDAEPAPAGLHWKTTALVRMAAGRPFVWLDDEIGEVDQQWVEAAHTGPALLCRLDRRFGLLEPDVDEVRAWLRDVCALPKPLEAPAPLRAIMDASYDYDDGRGVDFEPYQDLEDPFETGWWFRYYTGNPVVGGDDLRPFGSDGAGGYAAAWIVRDGAALANQPVVFLGSDGDVAVLAADAYDALWLFALGLGPHDVLDHRRTNGRRHADPGRVVRPVPELMEAAERLAADRRRPAEEIIADATAGLPEFEAWVDGLCR